MCRTPNLLWFRITDKPLAIQQSTFAYSALYVRADHEAQAGSRQCATPF